MGSKKKVYEVEDHETVSDCLDRMQKDGYMPIKRIEKPIFQEKKEAGQVTYEPVGRKVTFEARKVD